MAIKKVRDSVYNGTGWDTLYAETSSDLVKTTDGGNLQDKVGRMGETIVNGLTTALNIGGNKWLVTTTIAAPPADSTGGCIARYNIETWLKYKNMVVRPWYQCTNNNQSGITVGYVADHTPEPITTQIIMGLYNMAVGYPTRVRIQFIMESSL